MCKLKRGMTSAIDLGCLLFNQKDISDLYSHINCLLKVYKGATINGLVSLSQSGV